MRWGAFSLLLAAVAVLQTTALGVLHDTFLGSVDLFLVLALLYGLCAPARGAPLAAWLIGLAQDLLSLDALGVHALALSLAVLLLVRLREWTFIEVWWVQIVLGSLGGLVAGLLAALFSAVNLALWSGSAPPVIGAVGPAAVRALVAAILAATIIAAPSLLARPGSAFRIGRARR